jgi:hypothetical protein
MLSSARRIRSAAFILIALLVAAALLAGCGGAVGTASTASSNAHTPLGSGGTSTGPAATPGPGTSQNNGPQYLIKSLQVSMTVYRSQQVADDLLSWVATTDPRSTTAGQDYEQVPESLYSITLRFSVHASLYPQIEHYLAGYAAQHSGKLDNLHETVQDVTTY